MAMYWLLGYFQKPFWANFDFVSWSIMKNINSRSILCTFLNKISSDRTNLFSAYLIPKKSFPEKILAQIEDLKKLSFCPLKSKWQIWNLSPTEKAASKLDFPTMWVMERLRVVEKLSCFEITAFFTHCAGEFLNYPESFLYCLYSRNR